MKNKIAKRAAIVFAAVAMGGLGFAPSASAHVGSSICEATDPPSFDYYLIVHAHQTGSAWNCYSWNRVNGAGRQECFWTANSGGVIGGYSCGHDVW